jgi:hypothetical protein
MAGDRSLELYVQKAESYHRRALDMVSDANVGSAALLRKLGKAANLRDRPGDAEDMDRGRSKDTRRRTIG